MLDHRDEQTKGSNPMSEATGTFTVINNTGGQITNVVVTHTTSDYGTQQYGPATLADGTMGSRVGLKTSSSNTDRYTVSFSLSTGAQRTGNNNCGFESEDSGGNVEVILNASNFSIINPASSSHADNDYDQT
jgi:hypothetical protein